MLNFNQFKFQIIKGPQERIKRRENELFKEVLEKFSPHIRRSNIISGRIRFDDAEEEYSSKAFDYCMEKSDAYLKRNEKSLYDFSLSGSTLVIDNVEKWLDQE